MKASGFLAVGLIFALAALPGCKKEEPPATYSRELDTAEARAMIDRAEWLKADLQTHDELTRDEAQSYAAELDELLLPAEGENIVTCALADAADWEREPTLALRHDYIQPTVYHEGVEITSAEEESSCDKADGGCENHYGTRRIRKEYTGGGYRLCGRTGAGVFAGLSALADWYSL